MDKEWLSREYWLSWGAVAFLYVLPSPLLIDVILSLIGDNLRGVIGSGSGYLLFIAAATLLRRGLANDLRRRRRPSSGLGTRPLKVLSASLIAIAISLVASLSAAYSIPISLVFGAFAGLGCLLLYGFDETIRKKVKNGGVNVDNSFATIMNRAYGSIENINKISRTLINSEFRLQCMSIVNTSRDILSYIELNPDSFHDARKFLNVYLEGAEQLISQYAHAGSKQHSSEREHNFRTLLTEMDNTCREQYVKLQQKRSLDLDIQIEVLTTRLKHEGIG